MNVERLGIIRGLLADEAELAKIRWQFDMSVVRCYVDEHGRAVERGGSDQCGTAGCAAGLIKETFGAGALDTLTDVGARVGLTSDQSIALFEPCTFNEETTGIDVPSVDHPFYTAERAAEAVQRMIDGDNNPWLTIWSIYQNDNGPSFAETNAFNAAMERIDRDAGN